MIAAVGLTLPWVNNGAAAVSLSAFDLAEWTTIVPEVRYGGNAMTLPYNLRLLVVIMVFAVSLIPKGRFSLGWFICAGLVLAGVIGLLPPFEYFIDSGTGFRGDSNYNQLMSLAWMALVVGLLGLSGLLSRFRRYIMPISGFVGITFALLASSEALTFLNRYLTAQMGNGVAVFCVGLGLMSLSFFWWESKESV
jgi:hypothetical protein